MYDVNAISPRREQRMVPFCFYQPPACILWALHALVLRRAALPPYKSHAVARSPPPIFTLPFLLLPQTSRREDCLFLQGVTFSMVNQMTRKIIQISPPLHPPFFLYEVIYTLGIQHRHCCCSRSVTDTSVTINSIYLP